MLSIIKINSARHQASSGSGTGYSHYLEEPSPRAQSDFDDYARGGTDKLSPKPFWACKGAALLGLDDIAEAEQVERLAKGFHPITGAALVKGAGEDHVMGLDMTFSAPKDFSAVFGGADAFTQELLLECLRASAKTAMDYAEASTVSRHGQGGRIKQFAEAAIAACYVHLSSRALDAHAHIHAFLFNVAKRRDGEEWSAVEQRPMFERKLAIGIMFRAELAHRLKGLGFAVVASGPYFTIEGVTEHQREQLSTRSREIAEHMRENGMEDADPAARAAAALSTRSAKAEPPLPELLAMFREKAASLGITPLSVAQMRATSTPRAEEFKLDHALLLEELTLDQSCATAQEALALICEKAMCRWSSARCLEELGLFMEFGQVIQLGRTEHLTQVFTSKATRDLEASISAKVEAGASSAAHRVAREIVGSQFDAMEKELEAKLGVAVTLAQQREAALHIACETGAHAFVEGWAGTGKTTMLKALGAAYKTAGMSVVGCCQSAAASQNLARETGIPSRTIASLLLSLREGRAHLHRRSVIVLDEAGMVGSREFSELQAEALAAGAKLVSVGDPKQLQPIDAGGIFGSLMRRHGKAEISNIQRQRTDFEPIFKWLSSRPQDAIKAQALRSLPEDARMAALEGLCRQDAKLAEAFRRWQARFDFEWMREAVEGFAKGEALGALELLESKGRLRLISGQSKTCDELISAWARDKTPLASKAIVAGTRAEVAHLNALARGVLISKGVVKDFAGTDAEIIHRDETTSQRRVAQGDRIVFTKNDRDLGVANGVSGSVLRMRGVGLGAAMIVELDDANERGARTVEIPLAFGRFDHAYCLTNHKSQGRTFDATYVLANPSMSDREWTYVAASRSRFATTMFVNVSLLGLVDPESHRASDHEPKKRARAVEALATRMRRSRAKGTSLDYDDAPDISSEHLGAASAAPSPPDGKQLALAGRFIARLRAMSYGKQLSR